MKRFLLVSFLLCFSLLISCSQGLETVLPEEVSMSSKKLLTADTLILNAIQNKEIPGAVLAVVKDNRLAYLKAYGNQRVYPDTIPMTVHTVFDFASCTKPIATGISTMILVEQGKIGLQDKVTKYIPAFKNWSDSSDNEKEIKIIDLLTHTSGLPPYAPVSELEHEYGSPNREGLIEYISTCRRDFEPETKFQYSCLNFIILQRIIEKVSGKNLRNFAKENIFDVLGLKFTDFQPQDEMWQLTAPTELQKDGSILKGIVHDPLAHIMNNGISGNAGLFSSAADLAVLVAMLQSGGVYKEKRILTRQSVNTMTTVPAGFEKFGRALGWDVDSRYSLGKGDSLSRSTYGHTGYTGTSIYIDPENNISIILLTNRVHPTAKKDINPLRAAVANAVAASVDKKKWNYYSHYFKSNKKFEEETPVTSNDIIMLGNSITEGGGDWNKRLNVQNIKNRGISGDIISGMQSRLYQFLPAHPKKIFIMAGINDVSHDLTTDSIANLMDSLVNRMKKNSPTSQIYLQSLLPIDETNLRYKRLKNKTNLIPVINQKYAAIAKKYRVKFIDLYPLFVAGKTNSMRKDVSNDGLHLNETGYEIWVKAIRKLVKDNKKSN